MSSTSCRWPSVPRTRTGCRAGSRSRTAPSGPCTTRSPSRPRRSSCCGGSRPADEITTSDGQFSFHQFDGAEPRLSADTAVRLMGVEQSNSSVVFDDSIVLKVFRKLEPGVNPELEVLRFLTWRGFPNIAPLHGWYDYEGQAFQSTLGVAQEFLPDAFGGWELALDEIWSAPEMFLERLGSLGTVTAQLHTCLASDASDPAFSPEEPSQEALGLLTATIDEDIERIFLRLPDDERARADRRPRAGRSRAARRARPDRRHRPGDPHPRRLPPRTDAAHAARLGDHRLRGRARPAADRAPPEALAAARRGQHAALVRVRRARRSSSCATGAPRPTSSNGRGRSSSSTTSPPSIRR